MKPVNAVSYSADRFSAIIQQFASKFVSTWGFGKHNLPTLQLPRRFPKIRDTFLGVPFIRNIVY